MRDFKNNISLYNLCKETPLLNEIQQQRLMREFLRSMPPIKLKIRFWNKVAQHNLARSLISN